MNQPALINPLFIATLASCSIHSTVHMLPNDLADNPEIGIAPFRQLGRSGGHIQDLHECINAEEPNDDGTSEMPSLDTLPLEIFHYIAVQLPPEAIWALALVCRSIYVQLYAEGSHLWKQLVQRRYDRFLESDKADWKYIYQSRNWAEKKLRREDYELLSKDIGVAHRPSLIDSQPIWKISGDEFLSIVRDMVIENDTKNNQLLQPSALVHGLRAQSQYTQLSAFLALLLSPIGKFDPHLQRPVFSATQKAVYVPQRFPLFHRKVPNFTVVLSILKFFQHHLDHMRLHIGPVTRQALNWYNAKGDDAFAFSPCPAVTTRDFAVDPRFLAGDWIGLYSYLGWADFEALRDENPAALEANQRGNLRDYLGGPQQLTIRIPKIEKPELMADDINITGEGMNGGEFTFRGKLKRIHIPAHVAGREMHLYWRITFTKTYAHGENSWTRWIYDGVYCPGAGILGRWRDGTEPHGAGVTGPFWIWPKSSPPINPLNVDEPENDENNVEDDASWTTTSSDTE